MNKKEQERKLLVRSIALVLFGLLTLINYKYDGIKYAYKNALRQQSAAYFLAYIANKDFEHGDYLNFGRTFVWANYCALVDKTSCEKYFAEYYAQTQARLDIDFKQSKFIEKKYQVGIDEVTVLYANQPKSWEEWGVLQDGALLTITEIGNGRVPEILTNTEVGQRLSDGAQPAFLFRVEENSTADTGTIPVAKTALYTGAHFAKALQEAGTAILGIDDNGRLQIVRGGELNEADLLAGSKLYWPINMKGRTIEEATDHSNLYSYIVSNENMHCVKQPSYSCKWIASIARTQAGEVVEIRLPNSLLYDEVSWPLVVEYLMDKGITDWIFADPMYEDSMLSAVDQIVKRDVLAQPKYLDPASPQDTPEVSPLEMLRTQGIEDGLYVVVWESESAPMEPILLEVNTTDFLRTLDSTVKSP